ncbi:hypothetical protein LEP1GSC041_1705 [Leptospira noguchii str. 2006001870]|nr:hypothetical protein LEP1GSC041_1705 [Leptospira noguchii str. 2006001870]
MEVKNSKVVFPTLNFIFTEKWTIQFKLMKEEIIHSFKIGTNLLNWTPKVGTARYVCETRNSMSLSV